MLKSKFRLSSLRKKNNKMIALSQLFYIWFVLCKLWGYGYLCHSLFMLIYNVVKNKRLWSQSIAFCFLILEGKM